MGDASQFKHNEEIENRKLAVKTQTHQMIVKVLELEQKLESIIKSDQTFFEDETFKSCQFSEIHSQVEKSC